MMVMKNSVVSLLLIAFGAALGVGGILVYEHYQKSPVCGAESAGSGKEAVSEAAEVNSPERKPGKYQSMAVIQVHPTMMLSVMDVSDKAKPSGNWVANEVVALTSARVLEQVVGNLQIEEQFGLKKGGGVDFLKERVRAEGLKGTDFIQVTAFADEAEDARKIAQEVCVVFQEIRREGAMKLARDQIRALDDELMKQGDIVARKRKDLIVLIQQHGIPREPGDEAKKRDGEDEQPGAGGEEKFDRIDRDLIANEYTNAKQEYEQAREMLRTMKVQQQVARVRLKMPREIITIHEPAR